MIDVRYKRRRSGKRGQAYKAHRPALMQQYAHYEHTVERWYA